MKEKHNKVSREIAARTARTQMLARLLETLKKNENGVEVTYIKRVFEGFPLGEFFVVQK